MAPDLLPLVVRNLRFTVRDHVLIDDISLTMEGSGVTVVMGPNGAGKSLLLRLLHGLTEPTSGSVSWGGKPPGEAVRRRQGMVFQHPVLLRRSVRANMEFALRQRGKGPNAGRCDDVLDRVGLSAFARRPARRLSGGEQQRLALARALVRDPEVLFMDEPSASLDPASSLTIESVVGELRAAGTKVVFVTHDVAQARRLADEVIFLHRGRLREQGPAPAFFERPESREARQYLAGEIVV